jgi:2-amino-4-hydroxy-6-hydroxymethyldihydropteridine diphosphokinase
MHTAYLSLGSNLGDRELHLTSAIKLIAERAGEIRSLSDFHQTLPWGYQSEHLFLNAALIIATQLDPFELLATTQQIESELGRERDTNFPDTNTRTYRDRPIDIDLLLYDDQIINAPQLTVPHPLMTERLFVLDPLSEIAPLVRHPLLKLSIIELRNLLCNN